jgi:2-iminobutanoate/2-iminopropanoate deaminase
MKPTESCILGFAKPAAAKKERKGAGTANTVVQPSKSPRPVGPYSHAMRAGQFLFCSGQIPLDPRTDKIIGDDIRGQTDRVLKNLQVILEAEKLSFENVVKTTVFLADMADFTGMNEVYSQYFSRNYPARSTVQVSALPRGARVEIEAVVCYPTE